MLCRHPMPGEGDAMAIAAEAPAGSIILWHGNTWHGAFRRLNPGIRLSIGCIYSRPYIWPRHPLREDVTPEILAANPPRFAKFCGKHVMTNWREGGTDLHAGPDTFLPDAIPLNVSRRMIRSPHYTEEHEIFRHNVRRFLERECLPHREAWQKDGKVSREVWRKMGDAGLPVHQDEPGLRRRRRQSLSLPRHHGGADAHLLQRARVLSA